MSLNLLDKDDISAKLNDPVFSENLLKKLRKFRFTEVRIEGPTIIEQKLPELKDVAATSIDYKHYG